MEILSYICHLNIKTMEGEVYHLIDRELILDKVKSLEIGSPERVFLLKILDESIKIHKPNHNYHIDCLIELCNENNANMIKSLQKCKI